MKHQPAVYEKIESVGLITLNRPNSKNAINEQMAGELARIGNEISSDNDVRAIIVTGAREKGFSIGTDIEEFRSSDSREDLIKRLSVGPIFDTFDLPIIAAINGDALGQGLELALSCDLRICVEAARFAMPHVTLGEIPWDGGTQRLLRLVGKSKSLEIILTGEMIDAQEAFRIGLVNKVVSSKELIAEAMDMARGMAAKGPIALRYAKEAICHGMDLNLEEGLRLEADLYFLLHTTRDRTEGIEAFREKRRPEFKGE